MSLFLVHGFDQFIWSYTFYFSSFLFIMISVITSAGRVTQILFKHSLNKPTAVLIELSVELLRLVQFGLFVRIGSQAIRDSSHVWHAIGQGLSEISFPQIMWDLLTFVLIFGVYNVIVYSVLNKTTVQRLMNVWNMRQHTVKSVQLAFILGFKNIFLIPVSIVDLFHILHLI